MNPTIRIVKWTGLFALVACEGASLGAFRLEWVRTENTGLLLYETGRQWLEWTFCFLPWGDSLRDFWLGSVLNKLTAPFPGLLIGGLFSLTVWFSLALVAAWQNCLFFPAALKRLVLCMSPLLLYLPLVFFEHAPNISVPHWLAVVPFAVVAFWSGATIRDIRRRCLPVSSRPTPRDGSWDFVPVVLVCLAATVRFFDWFHICCLRHEGFHSQGYDLALMSHVMKNLVTGNGLTSSLIVSGGGFLGHHFSPILYLIGPLYLFCPQPVTLFLVQSAAVAFAAVPLFLFAREYIGSIWVATALALTYLFLPGLSEGVYAEFHTISFAPLLLFWLAWECLHTERSRFWIPLVLILLVLENTFLYVIALAVFLAFHQEYRKRAWNLMGLSLAAGIVIFVVIQPILRPETDRGYGFTDRYEDFLPKIEGETPNMFHLVRAILTQPDEVFSLVFEKERRGVNSLFWRGIWFLPLWNPLGWVLLLPCLENVLSSEGQLYLWSGHYGFGPIALSSLSMVAAFKMLSKWPFASRHLVPFSWTVLFSAVFWGMKKSLLPYSVFMPAMYFGVAVEPPVTQEVLIAEIPVGKVVSTQSHLLPHITHQKDLHLVPPGRPELVDPAKTKDVGHPEFHELKPSVGWPEYIAYNPNAGAGLSWYNQWYFTQERTCEWCDWLVETGRYRRVYPRPYAAHTDEVSLVILERVDRSE